MCAQKLVKLSSRQRAHEFSHRDSWLDFEHVLVLYEVVGSCPVFIAHDYHDLQHRIYRGAISWFFDPSPVLSLARFNLLTVLNGDPHRWRLRTTPRITTHTTWILAKMNADNQITVATDLTSNDMGLIWSVDQRGSRSSSLTARRPTIILDSPPCQMAQGRKPKEERASWKWGLVNMAEAAVVIQNLDRVGWK